MSEGPVRGALPGRADAVVVGGGIIGCASALALAERGLAVVLLERERLAAGTTGRSFAWVNGTSKTASEPYHRLNAAGARAWRALATEMGERTLGLEPVGMIWWSAPDDAARTTEMRERYERLRAFGYPAAWVERDELDALEPHVAFEAGAAGILAHADACVDAPRAVRALAARLRAASGRVIERCEAQGLDVDDAGAVRAVETSAGRIATGEVVIACGVHTPGVLARLLDFEAFESRFPLNPSPGLLVRTPGGSPRRLVRHVLYTSGAADLHLHETRDGGLLLGADDTDGMVAEADDAATVEEATRRLLRRAGALIPAFEGEALLARSRARIGVRPVPADGQTIVGPVPGAEGLRVVATHSGITLGPLLGRLVAEAVDTGETPAMLAPFGLDRFQGFTA